MVLYDTHMFKNVCKLNTRNKINLNNNKKKKSYQRIRKYYIFNVIYSIMILREN